MRIVILALTLCFGACASTPAEPALASIEVLYSESMHYRIEDGGRAHFVGSGGPHPRYEFEASRDDFRQVASLLEPLKQAGLPCSRPSDHIAPGHIIWRDGGQEVRRVEAHVVCNGSEQRPLARNSDQAFQLMEEMGHARYVAPAIPEPTIITLQNMYWGRATATWIMTRGAVGRYVDPQRTVEFEMSADAFDQIREILRPYEERDFHCNRVVTDGPYGFVIWSSREGQEDQRTLWDAGCVTGDASDLFERLDRTTEILVLLRDAA